MLKLKISNKSLKKIVVVGTIVTVLLGLLAIHQTAYLKRAHSTFENYYVFRGCSQLLTKTDTYGLCKTKSGQTIKIINYNDLWYLDGDLPVCTLGICF